MLRQKAPGVWYLDLRTALGPGGGQHTIKASTELEATHLAYAKLEARRAELAEHGPPGGRGVPTVAEAIDLFRPEKARDRRRETSEPYVKQYMAAVARERGKSLVSVFEGVHGTTLLEEYRNELADQGLDWKTRNNRLTTLLQVLRFAKRRGWLQTVPDKPKPKVGRDDKKKPDWRWYTEADFRRLRDGLFRNDSPRARLKVVIPDRDEREAFIARRRLYLSVAFYTGMHTIDLDGLNDESFSVGTGHFNRVNTKSSRSVPDKMFKMPEQLWRDVQEEQRRLGRPWFRDEPVAGGHWHMPTKEPNRAAMRLGLPPWTYRIARRSTAHHLCLLGWSERDVSEYLGHVDQTMIRAVYARVPIDLRSGVKLDWTNANMAKFLGGITATGKVLRMGPHAAPAPWTRRKRDTADR